jgi:hypothetical protein
MVSFNDWYINTYDDINSKFVMIYLFIYLKILYDVLWSQNIQYHLKSRQKIGNQLHSNLYYIYTQSIMPFHLKYYF